MTRRVMRLLVAGVVALGVGQGGMGVAQAQGDQAAQDRRKKASEHVQKGDEFKKSRDYKAAAREYERAYELVPHPVLFFNLGQVHRLDGDRKKAIEYYQRYLAVEPSGRASAQAQQFIAELKKELAEAEASDPVPPPDTDEGAPEGSDKEPTGSRGRSGSAAGSGSESSRPIEIEKPAASPPPPGRGLRIAGMVTAGVGLVALGVGVKFGLDARSISNDITNYGEQQPPNQPWPDELLAKQDDGKRAERNMFILTGVGAAAFATGGILYFLGRRAGQQPDDPGAITVAPSAGDRSLGLVVGGRF